METARPVARWAMVVTAKPVVMELSAVLVDCGEVASAEATAVEREAVHRVVGTPSVEPHQEEGMPSVYWTVVGMQLPHREVTGM